MGAQATRPGVVPPRWVNDAYVQNLIGIEGLVAAVADDPAHRLGVQHLGQPHPGGGAAAIVLGANQANRCPAQRLREPAVVFALFALHVS